MAAASSGTVPCQNFSPGTLTAANYNQSFTYDGMGRLTNGPLGAYSYAGAFQPHGAYMIGTSYTAAYDGAGNMTCRAVTNATTCRGTQTGAQLAYSNDGQLSNWQDKPGSPTTTAAFLYDGQGTRVAQQIVQGGVTSTVVYVGDIEQVSYTVGGTSTSIPPSAPSTNSSPSVSKSAPNYVRPRYCTGPPTAPTNVHATAGNGQASITWTAATVPAYCFLVDSIITSSPGGITTTVSGTATSGTVTGLTNGTTYTFTVYSEDYTQFADIYWAGPNSAPSNQVTPPGATTTVPGAPQNVTASGGNVQAAVSWSAPASNGGSAITGYTVTSSPGGFTAFTNGSTTTATVTGLTNGTSYTFTVTATNSVGTGPASAASNSVTPAGPPGAPISVSATAGNAQAAVSWTAPTSNGGASITSYTVTSSPGSITATTTTTSAIVTGLTNGTAYAFTVKATNSAGTGPASAASNTITPVGPPGAPTNLSAAAGNAQAGVSWTAPASNGGSPITSYAVTSSPGGLTATSTTTSATISGLTNGTSYSFTVTATNAAGMGPASAASNRVTPVAVPGPPSNVTATAGNAQATVSWTAPTNTGGSAITSYTVTSSPGGISVNTPNGSTTSATVTGLTNGTGYTFTVTATNAVGTGQASSPSNVVTPVAAATHLQVTAVSPSGNVAAGTAVTYTVWSYDANNNPVANVSASLTSLTISGGGSNTCILATATCTATSPVGGHTVTFALTGLTGTTATHTITAGALASITISPVSATIVAGGSQTYSATGFDSYGNSRGDVTSATAFSIYPTQNSSCTGAVCTSTLSVSGSYTVTGSDSGFSATAALTVNPATLDHIGFAFPTGGSSSQPAGFNQLYIVYSYDVYGNYINTNVLGSGGTLSSDSNVVCSGSNCYGTALGAHTVTATYSGKTAAIILNVTFLADSSIAIAPTSSSILPGANQTYVVTGYDYYGDSGDVTATTTLTISPNGGSTGATCNNTNHACTATLAGTYTVTATNTDYGTHTATSTLTVTSATAPGAPTGATATGGNAQATVSWTVPGSNGGSAITYYTVTSSPGGFTAQTANGSTTTATVTALTNGTSYTFTVTATNSAGMSPASSPSNAVTPATVPGQPTGASATAGNAQATVSWTAPGSNGGSAISYYKVTSSPGGFTAQTANGTTTTSTVTGLTNGTSYTFTVTATNAVGTGPASAASNAVMPIATVPGAPTGASATAGNAQASVSWTAPSNNGGSAINFYKVTSSPGGFTTQTANGSMTTATVTGLSNGTSYTFTVTATNSAGTSPASAPSNAATPAAAPGAPINISAVAGMGQATITWTAAPSNGGAITSSTVTSSPGGLTASVSGSGTTAIVTGLTNGTAYTFTVTSTNWAGTGPASTASSPVTTGITTRTYYYASGMRIAMAVNGLFSYLASDGLGSASVLVSASGSVTASQLFAPYGSLRYSSGTMPTDYGFTGQHADATIGLDYYGARYYDPIANQFTSADTVLPGGGYDIWGLSRYAYVEGNPIARSDPSGHGWDWWNAIKTAVVDTVSVGMQDYQDFNIGVANAVIGMLESVPPLNFVIEAKTWLDPNSTQRQETGILLNNGHPSFDSYQRAQNYQIGVEQTQFIQTVKNYEQHPFQLVGTLTVVAATMGLGRAALAGAAEDVSPAIKAGSAGGPTAAQPFSDATRQLVLADNPDVCVYCRMTTDSPQVDHAIPRARGGNATVENGQTTCAWCNPSKGARDFPVNPPPGYVGPWPPPWWHRIAQ